MILPISLLDEALHAAGSYLDEARGSVAARRADRRPNRPGRAGARPIRRPRLRLDCDLCRRPARDARLGAAARNLRCLYGTGPARPAGSLRGISGAAVRRHRPVAGGSRAAPRTSASTAQRFAFLLSRASPPKATATRSAWRLPPCSPRARGRRTGWRTNHSLSYAASSVDSRTSALSARRMDGTAATNLSRCRSSRRWRPWACSGSPCRKNGAGSAWARWLCASSRRNSRAAISASARSAHAPRSRPN